MNTENEKLIRDIASALDAFSLKIFALHQNGSVVSRIEADLLKEKLRLIYDKVDQLENGHSNNLSAVLAESVIMNPVESADAVQETHIPEREASVQAEIEPEAELQPLHIETTAEDQKDEVPPVETLQPEDLLIDVKDEKESLPPVIPVQPDVTVGSRYNAAETLSDRIASETHDRRLSEHLKKAPLQDLRRSIGLNERFAFIRGLFNGDQQSFYDSIDKINGMHDYAEAHQYFEVVAESMKWNRNEELVIELEELVKRRFGV